MKTAYLKETGNAWTIKVVVWEGTSQQEYHASSYAGALRIVSERHQNLYSPAFYDRDGSELRDNGVCFEREDGTCL